MYWGCEGWGMGRGSTILMIGRVVYIQTAKKTTFFQTVKDKCAAHVVKHYFVHKYDHHQH